ncbi:GntR family transcriptional regulator [Diaphorobacter aerolatus]|uniref:GntR family transcriptional regulator n=1 Tax=Diaphorobacter aerolatus TaxID=1288495 RepID=UPI001D019BDD|nr:GntR family transcriptional regulator [Diaphorobacter aerolatus]
MSPKSVVPPAPALKRSLPAPFDQIALDAGHRELLWRQLFQQISELLKSGAVSEGMSLPAERDMAQMLGVSRMTVKRCYDELRRHGAVGGRGRAGSVVQPSTAPPRVQPTLGRLKGFTEEMRELGMQASTELLVFKTARSERVASIFSRPVNAPFLHVVRIRKGDGTPMTREQAWYDLTAAPQLSEWDGSGSAYAWLAEHCRLPLSHAEQTVEAVLSSADEMRAFGYESPQPCLLFKRWTYAGVAPTMLVEYVEGTFRGDAYVYKTLLTT